jgi:hypothetical protein
MQGFSNELILAMRQEIENAIGSENVATQAITIYNNLTNLLNVQPVSYPQELDAINRARYAYDQYIAATEEFDYIYAYNEWAIEHGNMETYLGV